MSAVLEPAMLSKRESELNADRVGEVICPTCRDEYGIYVLWVDHSQVVERDKECSCPIDCKVEQARIALHFNPPEPFWSPGLVEADERVDYEDNFLN